PVSCELSNLESGVTVVCGAVPSQCSSHLSTTAHGLRHSDVSPMVVCAVAVARTPWLVKPTGDPKQRGSCLLRAWVRYTSTLMQPSVPSGHVGNVMSLVMFTLGASPKT